MKNLYKELWFQVMMAMVLGLVVGLVLSPFGLGLLSENRRLEVRTRSGILTSLPILASERDISRSSMIEISGKPLTFSNVLRVINWTWSPYMSRQLAG